VATPNYSYEKRQKELAKKRKKEDKLKRKAEGRPDEADEAEEGEEGEEGASGLATGQQPADLPPGATPA
jgi:hypothetical protein